MNGEQLFSVVEVETSTACNLRCNYCPNSVYERGLLKNDERRSFSQTL